LYRHAFVCSRHLRQISGVTDMEQSLVRDTARVSGDANHSEPMPPPDGLSPQASACCGSVDDAAA
jgi:hypothetical protein